MRVAIGYIHGGNLRHEFAQALRRILLKDLMQGVPRICAEIVASGPYIAENRNKVVKLFMDTGCDALWFIDIDIDFPDDLIDYLIHADKPIVGALYVKSDGEPTWTDPDGSLSKDIKPGELRELSHLGMGCTLIQREVFEKINNDDPWRWFGHDIVGDRRVGEDETFCRRAREVGYKAYGLAIPVDHWKLVPLKWES